MRTKFHNRWTQYKGLNYQSKKEATYAQQLDIMMQAGIITGWQRQVRVPLVIGRKHICWYVVDFVVQNPDGVFEYHEVKGYWTDVAKLKWKLFKALYPDLLTRII